MSSLIDQYRNQSKWRRWDEVLELVPLKFNEHVLDLGCGPGEISRLLALSGAKVTGIDRDSASIEFANAQHYAGCTFLEQDLKCLSLPLASFDGLWCSFTAAYFTNFSAAVEHWLSFLKPNAWMCFVEMEALLDHNPLPSKWRQALRSFENYCRQTRLYDFYAGQHLASLLREKDYHVSEYILDDDELSANGPLPDEILAAWRARLCRMPVLERFLSDDFKDFCEDFMSCLTHPSHSSNCTVRTVIARKQ